MGYVLEEELKPVLQTATEYAAMKMLTEKRGNKIFFINGVKVECWRGRDHIICRAGKGDTGIILHL